MSTTFRPSESSKLFEMDNPHFIPTEVEDPVFNPRTTKIELVPECNVSEFMRGPLLNHLGFTDTSEGTVPLKELPALLNLLYIRQEQWRKSLKAQEKRTEFTRRLPAYIQYLQQVVKTCIILEEDMVWF